MQAKNWNYIQDGEECIRITADRIERISLMESGTRRIRAIHSLALEYEEDPIDVAVWVASFRKTQGKMLMSWETSPPQLAKMFATIVKM